MKKFYAFTDRYGVPAVTFITLPALIGGEIFQTEGFSLVPAYSVVFAMFIGAIIGILFMRYVISLIRSENLGRRLGEKDSAKIVRSAIFTDMLFMALTWMSGNIPAFLLGAGGTFMCFTSLFYYVLWRYIEKRKASA